MARAFFWLIPMAGVLVPLFAHSEQSLKDAYEAARRTGFLQVHEDYAAELTGIQKARLQAQDLAGANAAQEELERVQARIEQLNKGDEPSVPGLAPIPLEGDPKASSDKIELSPELKAAQLKFLDRLRRGVTGLNETFLGKATAAQKSFMAKADLKKANSMEELRTRLKTELGRIQGASEDVGVENLPGEKILDEKYRKYWLEDRGNWEFRQGKLVGKGDSRIYYERKVRPPFTLSYDFLVVEGMRPRVFVGDFAITNEGYKNQLTLKPVEGDPKHVPYSKGRRHSVRLVVNRRFIEFYLNDVLVDRREEGQEDSVEKIGFSGGDGFSAGITEFSNIRID